MLKLMESVDLFIVDEAHSVRHFLKTGQGDGKKAVWFNGDPAEPRYARILPA